jgi:hypothetical protein
MKGIGTGIIIALVIGVIISFVVTPLLFKTASEVSEQVGESLGRVTYSPIERALICYYYLCRSNKGCRDPTFNDFCGPQKIGREVYEEVCSLPSSLGVDGKQCGTFQFPIRLQLNEDAEIFKDRLKKKIDTRHLLIVTERTSGGVNGAELVKLIVIGLVFPPYAVWTSLQVMKESVTYIYFPVSNLGEVEEESYGLFAAAEVQGAVRFAKVKSGTYYISGTKLTLPNIPNHYFILVENFPRYLNLTSDSCEDVNVKDGDIIRISVEDERSEALKDYNYLMKIGSVSTEFFGMEIKKVGASIEFWSVGLDKQTFTCSECKGKEFDFKTKKGRSVKVKVKSVEIVRLPSLGVPPYQDIIYLSLKVCL